MVSGDESSRGFQVFEVALLVVCVGNLCCRAIMFTLDRSMSILKGFYIALSMLSNCLLRVRISFYLASFLFTVIAKSCLVRSKYLEFEIIIQHRGGSFKF